MPKVILILAFSPFDGRRQNQSYVVAKEASKLIPSAILGAPMPVVYSTVMEHVREQMRRYNATHLVLVGESPVVRTATVETIAHNGVGKHPDNSGKTFGRDRIDSTQRSKSKRLGWGMRTSHSTSTDAGDFLCNFVAWHSFAEFRRATFVHVPSREPNFNRTVSAFVKIVLDFSSTRRIN